MNADSAFQMGSSHAVCQDYALAGECVPAARTEGAGPSARPYVILSDGCSSSPDTDVGARLLVKAAERLLRESGGPHACGLAGLHADAARLALSWAELLGLRPQAVDATLLTAHLDGEELVIGCSGDGVVCLQTTGGALDVYVVSYPCGYPVYPAYAHQPARLQALADAGRARKEVTRLRAASAGERLRPAHVSDGGGLTEVFAVGAADYKFAALLSDGVQSFLHSGRAEAIPLASVLPELVSFKNTRGAFAGRRMKGFLKDCQQKGWRHGDDLSLAALHLGG